MSYLIASLNDVQGTIILDLSTYGDLYLVSIYDRETEKSYHKRFKEMADAKKRFSEISDMILDGTYSTEGRIKALLK